MSSWSELLDRAQPEEHVAQLYGRDDQLLARNVGRYATNGLRQGDGVLLIAIPEHAEAVLQQLRAESADVAAALDAKRLVILDARRTLDGFLVDGEPNRREFQRMVGDVLEAVRAQSVSGKVRAFGEMVGLLWNDGQCAAAVRLEEYWNELLTGSSVSLFCGYPIDIFASGSDHGGLHAVLAAHSHTCAGPSTVLTSSRARR